MDPDARDPAAYGVWRKAEILHNEEIHIVRALPGAPRRQIAKPGICF